MRDFFNNGVFGMWRWHEPRTLEDADLLIATLHRLRSKIPEEDLERIHTAPGILYNPDKELKSIPLGMFLTFIGVCAWKQPNNAVNFIKANTPAFLLVSAPVSYAVYKTIQRAKGYTRQHEINNMYSRYYFMSRNMLIKE